MSRTGRRKFSSEFKAKVAIEALQERETLESLCKKCDFYWTSNKEYLHSPKEALIEGKWEILHAGIYNELLKYSVCNKIYKRECFVNLRFQEGLLYEDMHLSSRIYSQLQVALLSQKGCYYYRHVENSIMHSEFTFQKQKSLLVSKLTI